MVHQGLAFAELWGEEDLLERNLVTINIIKKSLQLVDPCDRDNIYIISACDKDDVYILSLVM